MKLAAVAIGGLCLLVLAVALAGDRVSKAGSTAHALVPTAPFEIVTRFAADSVPVYSEVSFSGDPVRYLLPGDTARLAGSAGRVPLLRAGGDTVGYVLAPLLRDSLSAAEQAALQERRIALIAAAERRNRLGFKVLTPKTEVVFDAGTLRVRSVAQSGQWVMDRYDDTYHYRDAVRGSKFVVADVSISSEIHDPRLPAIGVYRAEGNSLRRIGAMHYEFYRWRDFGSYLGNYADYGNDFAHSSTIRFSPGVEVSEQEITGAPVFILVGKAGCVTREHARFGNPEISYSDVGCSLPYSLNLDQAESGFVPIRIFGRDLL